MPLGDHIDHVGGNDGLHHHIVGLLQPLGLLLDHIIEGKQGCLVSIHQNPLTFMILHTYTHTVGIRVGTQQDIRIEFPGIFRPMLMVSVSSGFGIDHRRKVAVGIVFVLLQYARW